MCGLQVCTGTMVTRVKILFTILCLSCASTVGSSATLSFRSEPLSAVQRLGGVVHLRCSAQPPTAQLSWRFNGKPLDPSSVLGIHLQAGSLTLSSLEPSQAGSYQCVAHSDAGAVVSRQAHVTIAGIAEFAETQRRTLAVEEGSTALIVCPMPHSNPPAVPRLRVRGKWLEQSSDDYVIFPSGNLQIKSASPQHQGTYKCAAYNPLTQETRVEAHGTKIIVKRADDRSSTRIVFPVVPRALSVLQSAPLALECVLSRNVSASAHWTKDGKELLGGTSRSLSHNNLLLAAARRSDAGQYQCVFHTDGEVLVSANYTVTVLEPASVVRGLADQSLSSGSAVRFVCIAKGHPVPSITWLFNSNPVTPSARIRVSGSALRIAAVTEQDQGVYQCLLDNGVGSAQSAGALTVVSGLSSKPVIVSPPLNGTFQEGDDVFLSCNASGQPLPVIRWYNSDGPIATHPTRLLQPLQMSAGEHGDSHAHLTMSRPGSSSLYIQAVTAAHAGRYKCEASNRLGTMQAEAFLTVGPLQSTTVSIAAETPHFLDTVQGDEGGKQAMAKERPGHGRAVPADRPSGTPTPDAPIITSPPQTHRPDVYDLEWRPGRDWGSPINAYFVKYRKLDEMGNVVGGWHTVRVPGSEKSLRLSELEALSLYEVLMVARSDAGDGQPAMLTFRTGRERSVSSGKKPSKSPVLHEPETPKLEKSSHTHFGVVLPDRVPEAPDRPTVSMATETSVYVAWIPRANGGSPITAFRVEYRRQGRSTDWVTAADNISPLKLSVEVRDLEPGSMYRFRVVAANVYGESPHSGSSRQYQVSPASPPLSKRPVTGPHISSTDAVSDTQIMLRWTYTPSSNDNTPIQGFYIYYRPTDSDNDSDYQRDVVEGLKQWHLIGQLQPETSYDIKMQCFNEGGESEYSNVMICETKARAPPGAVPVPPATPPGHHGPDPPTNAGGLLYLIVGCVLGVMVLILLAFIAMCLWRNRQQDSMQKFDPPSYLYQPADMNGHALDYGALPPNHANGSAHTGYGSRGHTLPPACAHLHHKLPNGLALLGNTATICAQAHPHAHKGPAPHGHLHAQDGGMYSPLPQSDPSECMNCQNVCNNNRCYSKTNAGFANGGMPVTHLGVSCQQEVLEMTSLGHVTPGASGANGQRYPGDECDVSGRDLGQDGALSPAQLSCCQGADYQHYLSEYADEDLQYDESDRPGLCWDSLDLPELDCHDKAAWTSTASHVGRAVQPSPRET